MDRFTVNSDDSDEPDAAHHVKHRNLLLGLRFTQEYEKLHLMQQSKALKHKAEILKLKQKNAADEIQLNMLYEADILQILNETDLLAQLLKMNKDNVQFDKPPFNGHGIPAIIEKGLTGIPDLLDDLIDTTKKNHEEILEDIKKLSDDAKPYVDDLEEIQTTATRINKLKEETLIRQKYDTDILDLEKKPTDKDELYEHESYVFTKRQAINDRAFLKMHARDETKILFQITNSKVDEVLRNVKQVDKSIDQFECGYLRRRKDKVCGKKFIAPLKHNVFDDKPCSPFPRGRLHKKRDDLCDFDFKLPFNKDAKKCDVLPFAFNRNKFCSTPSTSSSR